MFTGLIETVATAVEWSQSGGIWRLGLAAAWPDSEPTQVGDSVAVNGCCLTAVAVQRQGQQERLQFELSAETLARTAFGSLQVGTGVNCERAAKLGQRLGGHIVTGHVDATAVLAQVVPVGGAFDVAYELPAELLPEVVIKGSVAIDGVSLTVNAIDGRLLRVMLIPHTVAHTQLLAGGTGKRVHVETDLLAKHVRRLLQLGAIAHPAAELPRH